MSDGSSWTPGELPDVPSAPPVPTTPPSAGQLSGWEAPAPSSSPYGPPPASSSPYGAAPYGQTPHIQPAPGQLGYAPQPGVYPYAPYAPVRTGTDGFAIAALILGIVGGWLLAFVFGGVALGRIKKSGQGGRGMAITGIVLGSVWAVVLAVAVALPVFLHQRELADLHASCAGGDMAACDQLYETARNGSTEQQFGDTCGGRTAGGTQCVGPGATVAGAFTYGDDPALDDLWDQCEAGSMAACDELYYSSDEGTDYEWFGGTCGNRTDGSTECVAVTDEQGA